MKMLVERFIYNSINIMKNNILKMLTSEKSHSKET